MAVPESDDTIDILIDYMALLDQGIGKAEPLSLRAKTLFT